MKELLTIILLMLSFAVCADQRFETAGGYSHFVLDPANADNEIYFANCENVIQERNAVYEGNTHCRQYFTELPWRGYFAGDPLSVTLDNTTTATTCNMVTSNYDAGNDKWNQNERVSNDWNAAYVAIPRDVGYMVTMSLECRNGQ